MTPKLQAMRDALALKFTVDPNWPNVYKKGFNAALAELWPVIEAMLECMEDGAPSNLQYAKEKLGID